MASFNKQLTSILKVHSIVSRVPFYGVLVVRVSQYVLIHSKSFIKSLSYIWDRNSKSFVLRF